MTYRIVLYLKSKLKTFPFDRVLSVFGLQSIFDEIGSNKVVLFFDANFMNAENCKIWYFWSINFSSYLWSYLTYRTVLYLKLKLKIYCFDLILSDFWLKSIFHEIEKNEVDSFFFIQTLVFGRREFWPLVDDCFTVDKSSFSN